MKSCTISGLYSFSLLLAHFTTPKLIKISGLVKEAFFNVSKLDLLSVTIIVEPGSFAAKADASSRVRIKVLYKLIKVVYCFKIRKQWRPG